MTLIKNLQLVCAMVCVFGAMLLGCESPLESLDEAHLVASLSDSTNVQDSADHVHLETITFYLEELRFEGEFEGQEDVEIRREYEPPVPILLLALDTEPLLQDIPAGPYHEFELRLKGPDYGHPVMRIIGSLTDSLQQGTPFEIHFSHEFDIRIEHEDESNSTVFDIDYINQLQINERLLRVINGVDPSLWLASEVNDEGVLVVSRDTNIELYQALIFALGEDLRFRNR